MSNATIMNQPETAHSFRRLLNKNTPHYTQYVLSKWRYSGLVKFLEIHMDDLSNAEVVDIGCGAGIVSRGMARASQRVTGIDGNKGNIDLAKDYAHEESIGNVNFKHGYATDLPIDDSSMDIVLLNGVLEWVGVNNEYEDPQKRQLRVLGEAFRVLRPGGSLYLGIENRWHPATLLRDPHSNLPLVNALPRKLADIWARNINEGAPFQTYIYGHKGYEKLLKSEHFNVVEKYIPFPGYQYPSTFIRPFPKKTAIDDIAKIDTESVREVMRQNGRDVKTEYALKRLKQKAFLGVLAIFTHDLVLLARKPFDTSIQNEL